jgi:hypothetical protein
MPDLPISAIGRPEAGAASPAALAPLFQVGALVAERCVAAVAGVDPGLVRQDVEDLRDDALVEAAKRSGSFWVLPTPPGSGKGA